MDAQPAIGANSYVIMGWCNRSDCRHDIASSSVNLSTSAADSTATWHLHSSASLHWRTYTLSSEGTIASESKCHDDCAASNGA